MFIHSVPEPVYTSNTNFAASFYARSKLEPRVWAVVDFEATAVPRAILYSVLLGTEPAHLVVTQTSHGQEI